MNASVKTVALPTINDDKKNLYVKIVTSKGTVDISIGEKTFNKLNTILEGAASTNEPKPKG